MTDTAAVSAAVVILSAARRAAWRLCGVQAGEHATQLQRSADSSHELIHVSWRPAPHPCRQRRPVTDACRRTRAAALLLLAAIAASQAKAAIDGSKE